MTKSQPTSGVRVSALRQDFSQPRARGSSRNPAIGTPCGGSVRFTFDPVDLFPLETVDLAEVHLLAGADLAGMSLTAQWTARSRDATGVLSGTARIPVDPYVATIEELAAEPRRAC